MAEWKAERQQKRTVDEGKQREEHGKRHVSRSGWRAARDSHVQPSSQREDIEQEAAVEEAEDVDAFLLDAVRLVQVLERRVTEGTLQEAWHHLGYETRRVWHPRARLARVHARFGLRRRHAGAATVNQIC